MSPSGSVHADRSGGARRAHAPRGRSRGSGRCRCLPVGLWRGPAGGGSGRTPNAPRTERRLRSSAAACRSRSPSGPAPSQGAACAGRDRWRECGAPARSRLADRGARPAAWPPHRYPVAGPPGATRRRGRGTPGSVRRGLAGYRGRSEPPPRGRAIRRGPCQRASGPPPAPRSGRGQATAIVGPS